MEYCAWFIGYAAYILNGTELHGMLDFIAGDAQLEVRGGQVDVPNRVELSHFVASLPAHLEELNDKRKRSREWRFGENTISLDRGVDASKVVGRFAARFSQIEPVLEQAESIGLGIKRSPYSEYLDEILETGIVRVEIHGIGLFNDGKLITLDPMKSPAFVVPRAKGMFRVYLEGGISGKHSSGKAHVIRSALEASNVGTGAEFAVHLALSRVNRPDWQRSKPASVSKFRHLSLAERS